MEDTQTTEPEFKGQFFDTLTRSNSKIKKDRAISIAEDVMTLYKREIEDMEIEKKRLIRERANMLDLSPTDTTSLVLASDFNSKTFIAKDLEIGVKLRNLDIRLDIAKASFKNLFE